MEPFDDIASSSNPGDGIIRGPENQFGNFTKNKHALTSELRLLFNKAVDLVSLRDNLYIKDDENDMDISNKLRKDGLEKQTYKMNLSSPTSNFSNVEVRNNQTLVQFRYITDTDNGGFNYLMPHVNKYKIFIRNRKNPNSDYDSERIYAFDMKEEVRSNESITNFYSREPESPSNAGEFDSYTRRSSFPQMTIHNKYFVTDELSFNKSSSTDWLVFPDYAEGYYTYCHYFLNNSSTQLVTETNIAKSTRQGVGTDGLIKLKAEAYKYPSSGYQQFNTNSLGYTYIYDNTPILNISQLSDSHISLLTHFIRYYESPTQNPINFILDAGFDVLATVGTPINVEKIIYFANDLKTKVTDKLKSDQDQEDYEEYNNTNVIYLNQQGNVLHNWDKWIFEDENGVLRDIDDNTSLFEDREKTWYNWGVGPTGLYKTKLRVSINANIRIVLVKNIQNDRIYVDVQNVSTRHYFFIKLQ